MSMTRTVIARSGLVMGATTALVLPMGPSSAAETLTWPGDALVLTSADVGYTSSFIVINETSAERTVTAAPVGAGPDENRCDVTVVTGATVEPGRHATVAIAVSPVEGSCDDPSDGTHQLVFIDDATTIVLDVKKTALAAKKTDPTGLVWPTEDVRMEWTEVDDGSRDVRALAGEFEVVNPTDEPIIVQPPTLDDECNDIDPDEAEPPFENSAETVDARSTAKIRFGIPACDEVTVSSMTVVASASTESGKADATSLTLLAETEWTGYGRALSISLLVALTLALAALPFTKRFLIKDAESKPTRTFGAKLLVDRSTPASWLTAVAAIGPLVTALFSTADLSEVFLGTGSTPQDGLVLAASAVAIVLVGLAGVIANIPLGSAKVGDKPTSCPYAWQFALAAAVSASAAYLQLWAVSTAIGRLRLAVIPQDVCGIELTTLVQWIGGVVIAGYLFASVAHYYALFGEKEAPAEAAAKPSAELIGTIEAGLLARERNPIDEQRQTELTALAIALANRVVADTPKGTTEAIVERRSLGLTSLLI